jgi:hypothetical protein
VLRAVAAGGLPVSDLYAYFMSRVPARERQDEFQRRLVVLLNDWDAETTPEGSWPGSRPVSGQSSETVMVTSMLPRVAFEYGHTW